MRTAGYENNPISLTFQRKNIQDDIAWIQWWSTWDGNVPPLGTMVEEIKANVPTALSYIESNINANFDFEFDAPDSLLTVQSIGWVSGNTVRYTLHTGFLSPSYALNHPIEIQGATNSVNNGIFLIDSIGTVGDNVYIHITNPAVSSGATDEATTSAFMAVPIYARTVLVADDVRVTNFNLYNDSARTSPRTQFNPDWFNPDATSAASVLQIGYNTDIDQTEPFMALEDDEEVFHGVLGGSRRFMHYFDNRTAYENIRYLPKNFETIYIDTLGVATFFMDIVPGDLPIGESRRYNILSAPQNDDNDVSVGVGRPGVGNFYTSDEGLDYVSILNGTDTTIEIYNNGDTSGWRITQPFEKYAPSASNTNVVTPAEGPLSMSIAEIVSAENQDPSFALFWITSNKIQLKGRFRYRLTMRVKLRFDGAEDTGVSFVNVSLVPTRTRGMTTIDLSRETGNSQAKIDFIRNGNDANDNTKPVYTLTGDLYYYAEPDDEIGWELRFGTFPPGYSLSDLRQIERQYTITAKGGIN